MSALTLFAMKPLVFNLILEIAETVIGVVHCFFSWIRLKIFAYRPIRVMAYNSIDEEPVGVTLNLRISPSLKDDIAVETKQCSICQRTFAVGRFTKHITICGRQASNARSIFESHRQRAIRIGNKSLPVEAVNIEEVKREPRQSNWRRHHHELMKQIWYARQQFAMLRAGKPVPPALPPSIPEDYKQCPNCCRNFGHKAAERHFPYCEEKFKRLRSNMVSFTPINSTGFALLEREERRRNYKPPTLRKREQTNFAISQRLITSSSEASKTKALRNITSNEQAKLENLRRQELEESKAPTASIAIITCENCKCVIDTAPSYFCLHCGYKL